MTFENRVSFDTIRTVLGAAFTGNFQVFGGVLTRPARLIKITNNTNSDLQISTNGVNAHDIVPRGGFVLYDLQANRKESPDNGEFVFRVGTQFWLLGNAGSTGAAYLTVLGAS